MFEGVSVFQRKGFPEGEVERFRWEETKEIGSVGKKHRAV